MHRIHEYRRLFPNRSTYLPLPARTHVLFISSGALCLCLRRADVLSIKTRQVLQAKKKGDDGLPSPKDKISLCPKPLRRAAGCGKITKKGGNVMQTNCDYCCNFEQDYETGERRCVIELDEDEMFDFMMRKTAECPYFRMGDEYKIVNKQI